MSVFAILIIIIGCGKNSTIGGQVEPNPNPKTVAAKIIDISVIPAVITDAPSNAKATVTITADGNPPVVYSVDNIVLPGNSFVTPNLFESKTYTATVTNSLGTDSRTFIAPATIGPIFSKLVGTTGKSYRYHLRTRQAVSDPAPVSILNSCELNDKFTLLPDGKLIIDLGSDPSCSVLSATSTFTFKSSTLELFFGELKTINGSTFSDTSFECIWIKIDPVSGLPVKYREVYVLY